MKQKISGHYLNERLIYIVTTKIPHSDFGRQSFDNIFDRIKTLEIVSFGHSKSIPDETSVVFQGATLV